MRICYVEKTFRRKSLALIKLCNEIIDEFRRDGYELTLRQLYYQLVGRAVIENNEKSYDNIGNLINDARLAGYVDWDAIVDRTRYLRGLRHSANPAEAIAKTAKGFCIDLQEGQTTKIEVWCEKDALVDIVGEAATRYDAPFFSCRGYTSATEMWNAAQRIQSYYGEGYEDVVILHFGDHDPSGLDMTRDITDRLAMFCEHDGYPAPTIERLALNIDQVRKYKLPPNPAKLTDCRATAYIAQHGRSSWELDAVRPQEVTKLICAGIEKYLDKEKFEARKALQAKGREQLTDISENFARIVNTRLVWFRPSRQWGNQETRHAE